MGSGLSRMGKAAKSMAADTRAMAEDVRQLKDHYIQKVWPQVNATLTDMQALLKETQTLVNTGTFTMKILALLLIVCILYIVRKQITSVQWRKNAYLHSQSRAVGGSTAGTLVLAMESMILHFISWTCLLMAAVFVIHLVKEIFLIANIDHFWPTNIPFIIIIPSVATTFVVLQHIKDIVIGLSNAILLFVYTLFGLPVVLTFHPAMTGSQYAKSSTLLLSVIIITLPLLYIAVALFPVFYLWEVYQLKLPLMEFILLSYLVFFAMAIIINIMGEILLRLLIKPLWTCIAKKSHYE